MTDAALSQTGRASPADDGLVKLVVKLRIPASESALLAALDARAISPEQRADLLARLTPHLIAALDAKFPEILVAADPPPIVPL